MSALAGGKNKHAGDNEAEAEMPSIFVLTCTRQFRQKPTVGITHTQIGGMITKFLEKSDIEIKDHAALFIFYRQGKSAIEIKQLLTPHMTRQLLTSKIGCWMTRLTVIMMMWQVELMNCRNE